MSFNEYKSIADVLQEILLTYTKRNFIEQVQIESDPYFQNRFDFGSIVVSGNSSIINGSGLFMTGVSDVRDLRGYNHCTLSI
jgi:hypothetical protein